MMDFLNKPVPPKLAAQFARLERMSPRERVVVTVCLCVVSWFVLTAFFVSPTERQIATYSDLATTQQAALDEASTELEGLSSGSVPPGDPDLHERLAQLEKENASVDASLRASSQYLVPPDVMSRLLQDLLRRDKRLTLVSMQTLPVAPILDTTQEALPEPDPAMQTATPTVVLPPQEQSAVPSVETTMFRHGVRLVLRGNYLDVFAYLREVEKLSWQMYWGSFAMEASEAGAPVFSLSIYTLSLDKSWLQI